MEACARLNRHYFSPVKFMSKNNKKTKSSRSHPVNCLECGHKICVADYLIIAKPRKTIIPLKRSLICKLCKAETEIIEQDAGRILHMIHN